MGQLQGPQARPQVAEGDGGDAADVVVSQGQLTQAAGQIGGDGLQPVGGQVQGFQRPDRKWKGEEKPALKSGEMWAVDEPGGAEGGGVRRGL